VGGEGCGAGMGRAEILGKVSLGRCENENVGGGGGGSTIGVESGRGESRGGTVEVEGGGGEKWGKQISEEGGYW